MENREREKIVNHWKRRTGMKRIIAGILALGAMLALGGCGEKAPEQMAREEYLPYVNGEAWDYVVEELEKGNMSPRWISYMWDRDMLDQMDKKWETMRGFRNCKDSIEELEFLYGDVPCEYLHDTACDIKERDITLNEWRSQNPSHREHGLSITYESEFERENLRECYTMNFSYEPDYRKQIEVYLSAMFLEKKES